MSDIRIGCSGWNYKHWRGRFYPAELPMKRWFAHYVSVFDSVEINNTFYRLPVADVFDAWREAAPPGFVYAVKASRFLTHRKKLNDPVEPIHRLTSRARHLGDRLGPLLYQLPPNWKLDLDRLRDFLGRLPCDIVHVFEFREASWMSDAVLALLEQHGASFCTHDMPGLDVPRVAVGPVAYVRFHGAGGNYRGRYPARTLKDWNRWMQEQAAGGRRVFAYFNNDFEAQAVEDARALKRLTGQG